MTCYPAQTPHETKREILGNIARVCDIIRRCAMEQDVDEVQLYYVNLTHWITRLHVIMQNIRQTPEKQ